MLDESTTDNLFTLYRAYLAAKIFVNSNKKSSIKRVMFAVDDQSVVRFCVRIGLGSSWKLLNAFGGSEYLSYLDKTTASVAEFILYYRKKKLWVFHKHLC